MGRAVRSWRRLAHMPTQPLALHAGAHAWWKGSYSPSWEMGAVKLGGAAHPRSPASERIGWDPSHVSGAQALTHVCTHSPAPSTASRHLFPNAGLGVSAWPTVADRAARVATWHVMGAQFTFPGWSLLYRERGPRRTFGQAVPVSPWSHRSDCGVTCTSGGSRGREDTRGMRLGDPRVRQGTGWGPESRDPVLEPAVWLPVRPAVSLGLNKTRGAVLLNLRGYPQVVWRGSAWSRGARGHVPLSQGQAMCQQRTWAASSGHHVKK